MNCPVESKRAISHQAGDAQTLPRYKIFATASNWCCLLASSDNKAKTTLLSLIEGKLMANQANIRCVWGGGEDWVLALSLHAVVG